MWTHHEILSSEEIFFNQKDNKLTVIKLISEKTKLEEIRGGDSTVV